MNKSKKEEIRAAWELLDDGDISTERLLQMVADACSCTVSEVVEAVTNQGDLK